jgi:hypothetical protein
MDRPSFNVEPLIFYVLKKYGRLALLMGKTGFSGLTQTILAYSSYRVSAAKN